MSDDLKQPSELKYIQGEYTTTAKASGEDLSLRAYEPSSDGLKQPEPMTWDEFIEKNKLIIIDRWPKRAWDAREPEIADLKRQLATEREACAINVQSVMKMSSQVKAECAAANEAREKAEAACAEMADGIKQSCSRLVEEWFFPIVTDAYEEQAINGAQQSLARAIMKIYIPPTPDQHILDALKAGDELAVCAQRVYDVSKRNTEIYNDLREALAAYNATRRPQGNAAEELKDDITNAIRTAVAESERDTEGRQDNEKWRWDADNVELFLKANPTNNQRAMVLNDRETKLWVRAQSGAAADTEAHVQAAQVEILEKCAKAVCPYCASSNYELMPERTHSSALPCHATSIRSITIPTDSLDRVKAQVRYDEAKLWDANDDAGGWSAIRLAKLKAEAGG